MVSKNCMAAIIAVSKETILNNKTEYQKKKKLLYPTNFKRLEGTHLESGIPNCRDMINVAAF